MDCFLYDRDLRHEGVKKCLKLKYKLVLGTDEHVITYEIKVFWIELDNNS